MSIALDRIGDSGFGRVIACNRDATAAFHPPPPLGSDDLDNWRVSSSAATSTSSIGQNSDEDAERSSDGDDDEVQSSYKGSLSMMDSLQEALPIRRGISGFYDGKSKSFTSLAEAAANNSSIKEIAKPENAYSRRRRNLLAINHVWDKNRCFYAKAGGGGGIYKRPISSSKSTLALAMAMSSSESISSASDDSSPGRLPPPCPQPRPASLHCWRSYSTADLKNSPCFSVGGRLELESNSRR